jgi:hypothetical protein
MTPFNSSEWVKRYEALRAHTLGTLAALQSQAWGLVVFVQQGMRGWMRAWQDPLRGVNDQAKLMPIPCPSLNTVPEATLLLANMTLHCLGSSL